LAISARIASAIPSCCGGFFLVMVGSNLFSICNRHVSARAANRRRQNSLWRIMCQFQRCFTTAGLRGIIRPRVECVVFRNVTPNVSGVGGPNVPSKKKPQGPQKEQKKPKSAVRKPNTKRPPVQPDESTDDPHSDEFIWDDVEYAKLNYAALGKRLAEAGDLFRSPTHGGGLLLMLDDGKHVQITKGADLLPVIVDRV